MTKKMLNKNIEKKIKQRNSVKFRAFKGMRFFMNLKFKQIFSGSGFEN